VGETYLFLNIMGVAIRDILADYKTPVAWDKIPGIAAIDGNNTLYQFLTIIRQPDGTPLMDHEGRITSHLSGLFFRISGFIEKGIQPVFIFDGKPPVFKEDTVVKRREGRARAREAWVRAVEEGDIKEAYKQARSAARVDSSIVESSKNLLGLMGIPVIDAPSEGEAQAAVMVQRGDVSYSVSQDYDSLLFGAPKLIRNLTVSGKRKIRGRTITVSPERIILSDVLDGLGVNREELIEIGILIGTDFNEGIRGVGAKTALKLVKKGEFVKTIREKTPEFDPGPVKDFFLNPPHITGYDLKWSSPDENGLYEMLCGMHDFSRNRVQTVLEKMCVSSDQKTLDQWF